VYTIAVIIPTLWAAAELEQSLCMLANHSSIHSVIIIDNASVRRPMSFHLSSKICCYEQVCNIGVAGSWNLGVSLASSDIVCLLNDDIIIDSSVFSWVESRGLADCSAMGMASDLFNYRGELSVAECATRPDGWGQCIFLRRELYIPIPLLHSFYTDDFIFDHIPVYTRLPNYQFSCPVRGRRSVSSLHFQDEFYRDRDHYNHITSLYPRYAYR